MNDEYFVNTRIDIRIDISPHDFTDADEVLILYRKPNGVTGEWTAEKYGAEVRYVTLTNDCTVAGTWQVQACAVYGTERKKGKICFITFKSSLN